MLVFSKLVAALVSPLGTALFFAVLGGWSAWRRLRRTAWTAGLFAFVWLYTWSTPWVSHALVGRWEHLTPASTLAQLPTAEVVVVLGGGVSPGTWSRPQTDLSSASDRVWHAARLYHAGKAPLVLASGGADPRVSRVSEADAMAEFLQALGVPRSAIWLERHSRNTAGNAQFVARWAATLPERPRILLVTSALHMPRALLEFRAAGLDVVPAPTDYEARGVPPGILAYLPDAAALEGSSRAFKELVGWMVAKL